MLNVIEEEEEEGGTEKVYGLTMQLISTQWLFSHVRSVDKIKNNDQTEAFRFVWMS